MSLFKSEARVTITKAQFDILGAKPHDNDLIELSGSSNNGVFDWKIRKLEDALGFTDMLGSFENVAESLGAKVTKDPVTKVWSDANSPVGVPKQMASRLVALLTLRDRVIAMYTDVFTQLVNSGSQLKDADKAALSSVEAFTKTQLTIINKKFPEKYTSYVNSHIDAKLKRDFSGLQGL